MISFELTDGQKDLREKYHQLAASRLRPLVLALDQRGPGPMDGDLMKILADERLNALLIPKAYGGARVDYVTLAVILEEIAWGSTDLSSVLAANLHAILTVLLGGSEAQKSEFLPAMLSKPGACASLCVTEEKGGSDSASFATTARYENGSFVLNGHKSVVINAGCARYYIVWASLADTSDRSGINAFMVPADAGGITVGAYYNKSSFRGVPTAAVSFEEVRLPESALIGTLGSGYLLLMQMIDVGRALVGANAVGHARAAIEEALAFAKNRRIRKRRIITNQGVGFVLAQLATELEAARFLVWRACDQIESGQDFTAAASMAKLFATELAVKATSEGMLIMGQKSLHGHSLMDKLQRDAQLARIAEGTSHIQRAIIANQL